MSDLTSPLGGDDLAKALRDAYGRELDWLRKQVVELCEHTEDEMYEALQKGPTNEHEIGFYKGRKWEAKGIRRAICEVIRLRKAEIAQYIARLPAAEPIAAASEARVGEDVRLTERQSEAPIYEAFARFVGDADERASDFRMFATGYHAAAEALKPSLSRKVDANVWKAAEHLNETQRSQPEWLWFVDDRTDGIPVARYTFGRWGKLPEQAPYVRADLALASAPSPADGDLGELARLSEAATPGTWYTVDTPWGDGTWLVAGNPDPHAGTMVCDCQDVNESRPEDEPDATDDAAFIAASANYVRKLIRSGKPAPSDAPSTTEAD